MPLKEFCSKTVISRNGRMFGKVLSVNADLATGELVSVIIEPAKNILPQLEDLVTDKNGRVILPFSAITSIGDLIVINEEDLV